MKTKPSKSTGNDEFSAISENPSFSNFHSDADSTVLNGPTQPTNNMEINEGRTLKSANTWTVSMPAPVNSTKGHLMPRSISAKRKRRISVEIHLIPKVESHNETTKDSKAKAKSKKGKSDKTFAKGKAEDYEEQVVMRILAPSKKISSKKIVQKTNDFFTVGAPSSQKKKDSDSVSSIGYLGAEDHRDNTGPSREEGITTRTGTANGSNHDFSHIPTEDAMWRSKYHFMLHNVTIKNRIKSACVMTTKHQKLIQTREVMFDSEEEAINFCTLVEAYKDKAEAKARNELQAIIKDGNEMDENMPLDILVEIVSASGLPQTGFSLTSSCDPYVTVSMDENQIHKTKVIKNTAEPIWTVSTDSLFMIHTTPKELFLSKQGLMFEVRDSEFGGDKFLGCTFLLPSEIYQAKGERTERKLRPRPGQTGDAKGFIAIRCRHATPNDIQFMAERNSTKVKKKETREELVLKSESGMFIGVKNGNIQKDKSGIERLRVRPGPDPRHVLDTVFLTEEEIEEYSQKESTNWYDAGTGSIGKIYLEVIGCDGLPNLDAGTLSAKSNKTDAFVSVVYEDTIVFTDVIDDSLCPRWMPWSRRAFVFHMAHPSSPLYLGAFDYDSLDDHDLIGRVSIDVTNLVPDTVYNLKYKLFNTANYTERKEMGSISVRLRYELDDFRSPLLDSLKYPSNVYVNVNDEKHFKVARYTCHGKVDMQDHNTKILYSYISELQAYLNLQIYLKQAILNCILWRGNFDLDILVPGPSKEKKRKLDYFFRRVTISIPLHSAIAFYAFTRIVENPALFPSYFCASVAWFLIISLHFRMHDPNPWRKSRGFSDYFYTLLTGKRSSGPVEIAPFENNKEGLEFNNIWDERLKKAEKAAARYAKEKEEINKEYQQELQELGDPNDLDITTKAKKKFTKVTLSPVDILMNKFFFWIQDILERVCYATRLTKNIFLWEESYFAFWISIISAFLSVVFLFIPWGFLISWTCRIIVWGLFGPWMKLVDIFYASKLKELTEEEEEIEFIKRKRERENLKNLRVKDARLTKENLQKLKEMKVYLFGKFITWVPTLKLERYVDIPLPESSAKPFNVKESLGSLAMRENGKDCKRISGQTLVGDMIPVNQDIPLTDIPVGQPTKRKSTLIEGSGAEDVSDDSTLQAIINISIIILGSIMVSWYSVPHFIKAVKWITGSNETNLLIEDL